MEKAAPNPGFVGWISKIHWADVYLSSITVAELWEGIASLPKGKKRRGLEAMFEMIPEKFADRIIPVHFEVARTYGNLQAEAGPLPVLDALIASTALTEKLTLVTRNTADFLRTGARILDPWT